MRAATVALIVVALVVCATAQQQCVITAQEASHIDYSGVKAACHPGTSNFCGEPPACTTGCAPFFTPFHTALSTSAP